MSVTVLTLVVALAAGAEPRAPAPPSKTLWLVQPLYPGQEPLISRAEASIRERIPEQARRSEVVGRAELAEALKGQSIDLRCLLGETTCTSPLDAAVANLGFSQVLLVKVGQDEGGYRFQVAGYRPSSGEVQTSTASDPSLERALFGALVKVMPINSTLEVATTPDGATVFVDNQKIGITPLSTQVLPGEHTVKIDLGGYKPVEVTQAVAVGGTLAIQRELEKLPARIIVTAKPPEAQIFVDGTLAGTEKIDQGVQPGTHTILITAPDHHPFQTTADIKPNDTYTLDKALDPTGFLGVKRAMSAAQENIYQRKSSFQLSFESLTPTGSSFDAKILKSSSTVRTGALTSPSYSSAHVSTVSAEYSTFGRYFGLMVIGAAYGQPSDNWKFDLRNTTTDQSPTLDNSDANFFTLRALQPQLRFALWRFTLSLQAGLETRLIRISDKDDQKPGHYQDAFLLVDLQGTALLALRFFIIEGFFVEGGYRYSGTLISLYEGKGPSMQGYRAGVGYAF